MNEGQDNDQDQDQEHQTRAERRAGLGQDYRRRQIQGAVEFVCKNHPEGAEQFRAMGSRAILASIDPEEFNRSLLAAIPGVRKHETMEVHDSDIGMNAREVHQYSITRAIASVLKSGRVEGLEREASVACAKRMGRDPEGFYLPPEICFGLKGYKRDLTVGTFSQGGAFVPTVIQTPIIDLLRNRVVATRLGAKVLTGLSGNAAIPRQTGAATAYSLPESATLTKSTQAIDQIVLAPHRLGAYNEYSKQLLLQSSVDLENFMRDDLMRVLSIRMDKTMLEGQGSGSEPTGVLNTQGIGSVHFGGAATFAKMVAFETALAVANADFGKMAYVMDAATRAVLKTTPKVANSTFPIYIFEEGDFADGSNDGKINGHRCAVTNQLTGHLVAFGHWADLVVGIWGGWDVVVNPYIRDIDAMVRITINTFYDVAVRHAASFAWSDDSGAQ
jgi:HK97 family phage major capsid protein